ncbi:MAG: hypothetical protein RLZZ387_3948 [Chloroflexota bacterium]|jgi:hypothetical protein
MSRERAALTDLAVAERPSESRRRADRARGTVYVPAPETEETPAPGAAAPRLSYGLDTVAVAAPEAPTPAAPTEAPATPGISEAEVAEREAAVAASQAALDSAADSEGLMATFAEAPPTVKAQVSGELGARLDAILAQDAQALQAGTPELQAEMTGTTPAAPGAIVVPAVEVTLEEAPPEAPPAEAVVGEPVQTSEAYRANETVVAQRDAVAAHAQAGAEQQAAVAEARGDIEAGRRQTFEQQQAAVADVERQADERGREERVQIDERVRADQEQLDGRYRQAEADAEAEVQRGEHDAEAERARAERDAEDQSWWEAAVDLIADLFNALVGAINAIFDAVRDAVNAVLDAVRDFALALIDLAAGFIKELIAAYGAFLKGLEEGLLGELFPELARTLTELVDAAVTLATRLVDAVAEGLRSAVNAVVESLRAAVNAVLDVYQAAVNTALALARAALTGDWGAFITQLIEAACRVAGIDPADVFAFLGRAQETLQLIVNNPGQFLWNVVAALTGGIQRFAQLVVTVVDAIGNIARGVLGPAQERVESVLGSLLPLAIDLLARLIGLGNVSGRVREILTSVQETIWRAIDRLIERAVGLFRGGGGATEAEAPPATDTRTVEQKQHDLDLAIADAVSRLREPEASEAGVRERLPQLREQYRLTTLELVVERREEHHATVRVHGAINPEDDSLPITLATPPAELQAGDWLGFNVSIGWVGRRTASNINVVNLQVLCGVCNLSKGSTSSSGERVMFTATVGEEFLGPNDRR